jgi:hypothetical protein
MNSFFITAFRIKCREIYVVIVNTYVKLIRFWYPWNIIAYLGQYSIIKHLTSLRSLMFKSVKMCTCLYSSANTSLHFDF